ncbi:MAG: hypothetical protein IPK26_10180 [Planctomycetes bacterium]|nr:hypothetical protein [Planctomycetota bacterium]
MAQAGWSRGNYPTNAATPTPGTFVPIEAFPRPGDPGFDSTRLCARVSGMVAFVDPMGTEDPNDDREYLAVGRSDGVFLIDVTPSPTAVMASGFPASNRLQFVEEQNQVAHAYLSVLNGSSSPLYPAYCGAAQSDWGSRDTTNREVAAFQLSANEFAIYAVNKLRPGIWCLRVFRETSGPNAGLLSIDTANLDTWVTVTSNGNPIGVGHHIVVDQQHKQLFIADDDHAQFRTFNLSATNFASLTWVKDYPGFGNTSMGFHEGFLKNGKVWVSLAVPKAVHVFSLPVTGASTPKATITTAYAGGHSCYVDEAPFPLPHLWSLEEDADPPGIRNNMERLRLDISGGQSVEHIPFLGKAGYPYGTPGHDAEASLAHNMRGNGRTVFLAHYTDGISLVDISGGTTVVLASFDFVNASFPSPYTTWSVPTQFPSQAVKSIYVVLDNYRGAWDVVPYHDSGVVHVAGGEKGAVSFRVNHGHLNRYWRSTPFQGTSGSTPSASPGVFPRIIAPSGPVRAGVPVLLMDENRSRLAAFSPSGKRVRYKWWLARAENVVPTLATRPWTHNGVTRDVDFNLDITQSFDFFANPSYGSDVFVLPATDVLTGDTIFVQMFVEEEEEVTPGNWQATGAWSASRGTWVGAVPTGAVE